MRQSRRERTGGKIEGRKYDRPSNIKNEEGRKCGVGKRRRERKRMKEGEGELVGGGKERRVFRGG